MYGRQNHSHDGKKDSTAAPNFAIKTPLKATRRILFYLLAAGSTVAGVIAMTRIMLSGGLTLLELTLLVLFSVTYAWIVTSFWNGAIGFILELFQIDPNTLKRRKKKPFNNRSLKSKTAIVMPIYNEDTDRVIAGFEAIIEEIKNTKQIDNFDFYLLSDSQNKNIIEAEEQAWEAFVELLPSQLFERVFYRRREKNIGRKVGNLADFCEHWGSYYEHMIVLDADSLMTGSCALELCYTLEDNPQAALIQTVPIPVRQNTFFGRFLQFAAVLHSPMLANGLAFWQTDSANYWGHNAIIRVSAFMDCCGLPSIPGKGPFSGDILSHDFVEAALLRRAGWHVYLLPNLGGSYEEVPSNMIDYATRDRRWVQGNIQHLALLKSAKLHHVSRLHFFFGAVAYITTLLWLLMLSLSTVDAIWRAFSPVEFFTTNYQLFPDWPVDNSAMIYSMFYLTAGLLLLPKIFALTTTVIHRHKQFGGPLRMIWSALVETAFSILIAPVMMFFHSFFVINVLLGKKVGWQAQPRDGRIIPWRESFKRTLLVTMLAGVWGALTFFAAPTFFMWIIPVLCGLVLAAPIIRYSSSDHLGFAAKKLGLFLCPSEVATDAVIEHVNASTPHKREPTGSFRIASKLLPSKPRKMQTQSFNDAA